MKKSMKFLPCILVLLVCACGFFAACGKGNDDEGKLDLTDSSKVLIAYFSATGNTEKAAGYIAEATGGTLYEIVPEVPYTEDDLKYYTDCRADREQSDPDARPAIQGSVENLSDYDVIFLGYPIWHSKAPKIIYTFLESYGFSGKTIIPFCTSASSGMGNSANDLHGLTSGANWLAGERFSSDCTQNAIRDWIDRLEYEKTF